jgi:hypothetical protein
MRHAVQANQFKGDGMTVRNRLRVIGAGIALVLGFALFGSPAFAASASLSNDFESGSLSGFGNTANATVDTGSARNGTYGLGIDNTAAAGYVQWTPTDVEQNHEYASLAFFFRVNSQGVSESVDLASLKHNAAANHFDVFLESDGTTLSWDLLGATDFDSVTVTANQWHLVQAEVFFGATTYTADVTVDGVYQGQIDSVGQTVTSARSLWLGNATAKTNSKDYDDVQLQVSESAIGLLGPTAPTPQTQCPDLVLKGSVDPNGDLTEYRFKWGQTVSMVNSSTWTSAGSGTSPVAVEHRIAPGGTTTYFRIETRNIFGQVNGLTYIPTCGN